MNRRRKKKKKINIHRRFDDNGSSSSSNSSNVDEPMCSDVNYVTTQIGRHNLLEKTGVLVQEGSIYSIVTRSRHSAN